MPIRVVAFLAGSELLKRLSLTTLATASSPPHTATSTLPHVEHIEHSPRAHGDPVVLRHVALSAHALSPSWSAVAAGRLVIADRRCRAGAEEEGRQQVSRESRGRNGTCFFLPKTRWGVRDVTVVPDCADSCRPPILCGFVTP